MICDFSNISSVDLLSLFQEKENVDYNIAEELCSRIINGRTRYTRLLEGDSIGITSIFHWFGIVAAERQMCPSKRLLRPQEQIEDEIETWAEEKGCWISELDLREESDGKSLFSYGTESVVYVDKQRQNVLKMMHPREGYEVTSLSDMLDNIALYNRVFSSSAYSVVGYGRNDAGVFCVVLKQPLIKGRTITNLVKEKHLDECLVKETLQSCMEKLGFEQHDKCWYKDQYLVTDITSSNIVIIPNGMPIVIDADVTYSDCKFFGDILS